MCGLPQTLFKQTNEESNLICKIGTPVWVLPQSIPQIAEYQGSKLTHSVKLAYRATKLEVLDLQTTRVVHICRTWIQTQHNRSNRLS